MEIKNMLSLIVKFIIILLIVVILIFAFTSLFLGLGYVMGQLFPLSLFEATLLCMVTTIVLISAFAAMTTWLGLRDYTLDDDEMSFEDDDDSDND
jgi:hypothetical protein